MIYNDWSRVCKLSSLVALSPGLLPPNAGGEDFPLLGEGDLGMRLQSWVFLTSLIKVSSLMLN